MRKKLVLVGLTIVLMSCNAVNDYLLGKDNQPKPKHLESIVNQVGFKKDWSVSVNIKEEHLKPTIIKNILYLANSNGLVQALDKTTAKNIWQKSLLVNLMGGPQIAKPYLLLNTSDSQLLAINIDNGQLAWKRKLSSDVLTKPLVVGNKVLVKTIDGNLYALNLMNGKLLWRFEHGSSELMLRASSSPVLYKTQVIAGYSDGKLDALDLSNGQLLWQKRLSHPVGTSDVEQLMDIDADPVIQGGVVYLASYQGYIGALSLSNRKFLWTQKASIYRNFVLENNLLYFTDSRDAVKAINVKTGEILWKQLRLKARGLTEPVLMNQWLVLTDNTGFLHLIDKTNGKLIARLDLKEPSRTAPLVQNNHIYLIANGKLSRYTVN